MSKMPVLFVGHGSPMNAIENNEFSNKWKEIAKDIPKPKAILVVSAHYYTNGTRIVYTENPKMIYDMYGFPEPLYEVKYPALGSTYHAEKIIENSSFHIEKDENWGIDHGAWSVLVHMYPEADIPVLELSINNDMTLEEHLLLGKELSFLRDEGVLILCSGNIVHNLNLMDWNKENGFLWAEEFDEYIKENIVKNNINNIINYEKNTSSYKNAFYTKEHFIPIIYALGAVGKNYKVEIFNDKCVYGSISMTCYIFD
ncbi:4,5-DOPA dioxygenase extradiol [bioreactor metagenome]|uniref:4,5-DOPA dioxygenase extradiol n=1 Tax=bioreactor metagenome TaxID=1076179 RepID=A0A644UZS0_9ZZZZ|nr:4,5-DOPA dioxygenase extradiol [Methanobrevibacter sp.]MEA4957514.1 4,5-DOPA dioxygenase extradiol [Methanobrevibacter sp.]